jgi:hypothetical protein
VVIRNRTTTTFIFDAEGSAHAEVEWTTFDEHDDVALLNSLDMHASTPDPVSSDFGEFLKYNQSDLVRLGIANFQEMRPGKVMLNTTRLHMLEVGAIRQQASEIFELRAWKRAAERALGSLGVEIQVLEDDYGNLLSM